MKAKTHTYGSSFIYTHIPTYESKDNYFNPTYFDQPWNHLFDRLLTCKHTHTHTHTCEQPYFHLTGDNYISTKATRTLCFSFIFIPVSYEY